jgi:glucose-1-phosphate thymidylyltransferase
VIELGAGRRVLSLEEKPRAPKSNLAVSGLYFYDNSVLEIVTGLQPSARGELEITDANRAYLDQEALHVESLGRGFDWLDTRTHESLLQASEFVEIVEQRQGLIIARLEEVALHMGFITTEQLAVLAQPLKTHTAII